MPYLVVIRTHDGRKKTCIYPCLHTIFGSHYYVPHNSNPFITAPIFVGDKILELDWENGCSRNWLQQKTPQHTNPPLVRITGGGGGGGGRAEERSAYE